MITEINADSADCSDNDAEYFEFRNLSGRTLDLRGVVLSDSSSSWQLLDSVVLLPGEYGVAYREPFAQCYGLTEHFEYPYAMAFANTGDKMILSNSMGTIDEVDFRHFGVLPGQAFELRPDMEDAILNDDRANWCNATTLIPGASADHGSPGQPNLNCPPDTGSPSVEPPPVGSLVGELDE